jgi:hypothetical protein
MVSYIIIIIGKANFINISIGLFSKPYSPLLLALWAQLTGVEES